MRIAILDFGTNTFNLLIAETSDENTLEDHPFLKRTRKTRSRADQQRDDHSGSISERDHRHRKSFFRIKNYKAEKVYAYATSAIREAKNGREFSMEVDRKFGLYVNVIPGEREAELIYKGVRQSFGL